jgi:hypothetical protein
MRSTAVLLILVWTISCFACQTSGSKDTKASQEDPVAKMDTTKKSIPSQTTKRIGNAQITINYNAPAVRGRTIWGELVPYNKVWVTGAHNATSLEISKDFMVEKTRVPAGKYAIFTIPSGENWTVILNKNWEQHLTDEYKEAEDIVRLTVKPIPLNESVERLNYEIDQAGERLANISMNWEKLQVRFSIQIVD